MRWAILSILLLVMCLTSAFSCSHTRGCLGRIPVDHVCCGDQIVQDHECCGAVVMKWDEICCGGKTSINVHDFLCCNSEVFPRSTVECCDGTPSPVGTCSERSPIEAMERKTVP